jgi:opacity protein-like surface antigen
MKVLGIGACATVVALCASSAWAGDYYVSGALSAVFRPADTTTLNQPTDPFGNQVFVGGQAVPFKESDTTNFNTGFEADVAFGRRFSLGNYGALRAEAEFGFRNYQTGSSTVTSLPGQVYATTVHASLKTTSGLDQERYAETANLFYDLPKVAGLTPYFGGGIGYQEGVQTSGDRTRTAVINSGGVQTNPVSTVHSDSASNDQGTWLAEVGVAVPLTQRLSLAPAYRFSQEFDGQKPIHLMRVALRYSF